MTASSSVNSPLHSSNYSPSLSSQISSKPVTPMYDVDSVIGLDTTSTTGSRPLYMEWTRDMVVTIKAGEYREQDAIIIRPPNEVSMYVTIHIFFVSYSSLYCYR